MSSNHFSIDPFSDHDKFFPSLAKALLATALFRCWHILLFFSLWATAISVISNNVHDLSIQPTLLTVLGTVLGFVISYRTTASFERYNEGRKYWSQIVLASRVLARTVWLQVPELPPAYPGDVKLSDEERRARVLVEKKTVINLIEAFAVAVKHYLRGEEGIHYVDLYHLVKFLPSYALPAGLALPTAKSMTSLHQRYSEQQHEHEHDHQRGLHASPVPEMDGEKDGSPGTSTGVDVSILESGTNGIDELGQNQHLPLPNITKSPTRGRQRATSFLLPPSKSSTLISHLHPSATANIPLSPSRASHHTSRSAKQSIGALSGITEDGDQILLPARLPPKYHLFDLFPFSLLVKALTKGGKELKGKKAARYRAKLKNTYKGRNGVVTHNVPLEISLYLTSYTAAITARKSIDAPTSSLLVAQVNALTDALTGLERILTTPIPFSYSIHLWIVTIIYCLALPFQVWAPLGWLTIPGTAIASFVFFGFIVAGEEIENPFGYDKNDLNMDHFTHNIIRNELLAITARPPPDPANWVFSPMNDSLFSAHITNTAPTPTAISDAEKGGDSQHYQYGQHAHGTVTPEEWVNRGIAEMQATMADFEA